MAAIVTLTMNPALDIATTIDRVVASHKLRCAAPRYDPGGGGINVARAIHALGGDVVAVFPSGGPAGQMIRSLLDGEAVPHRAIPVAGYTRESLNVEELASGKQYRFILPGPEISAEDQERCLDELAVAARQASYIVASGSLPPGVAENYYARAAQLADRIGARFALDTSGAGLREAGSGIYLLKPSLRELEALIGEPIRGEDDQERAARRLVDDGRCAIVVLSLGADGALLATAAGSERFAAIPVRARSTVGAGDSMLAGIVLSLSRGRSLPDAVRFGMAAGAAALLRPGTELCHRQDVERLHGLSIVNPRLESSSNRHQR